ncbi:MAG: hypothetical protein M3014_01325 [Chloroflexota bacterium]|nr:hypothetical protein [Chloroflexota bacterium]
MAGYLLSELVTNLARRLGDDGHSTWPVVALQGAALEAVVLHSDWFPGAEDQTMAVVVGQQAFALQSNTQGCRLLRVVRVELAGVALGEEAWSAPVRGRRASSDIQQAYRWRIPELWLLRPASSEQAGASALRIWMERTLVIPDQGDVLTWNGAATDLEIVLLLGARNAFQWLMGRQGVTAAPTLKDVIAALDVEIERERAARAVRFKEIAL